MSIDLDLVQGCDSLKDLPGDVQKEISDREALAKIPSRTALFDHCDTCEALALVLSGSVRVFTRSPSGREISLYRVNKSQLCIITLS